MPRVAPAKEAGSRVLSTVHVSIFPTELGWMGITGAGLTILSIQIGHASATAAKKGVKQSLQRSGEVVSSLIESDWHPQLRAALQEYSTGVRVQFDEFQMALPPRTPFRDKVLAATRSIGYGQTTTYGDLARMVGHPGAARAVGTVMSTNRFPILIPCHRVLAAGGMLGGYTSPAGIDLKRRLLELEQCPESCFI